MDGPNGFQCPHGGQVPAADQEHMETAASSRPGVLPGLPEANSPAQTVLAVGLRAPLPGTKPGQGAGQVTTLHLCQGAGHPGPQHTLSSWSSRAGGPCAVPGMADKPPRSCRRTPSAVS